MSATAKKKRPELKPLGMSCDKSDCENGLHCFRVSKKKATRPPGVCQDCGADLVDWSKVGARNPSDISGTVGALKKEWIRHHYWHEPIDQKAKNHALRKGRAGMTIAIDKKIRSAIGVRGPRDGRQTPWTGNLIFYAQHANACCCRRCVEYWHGIPMDRPLTEEEIHYFVKLCTLYIDERLPELKDKPQRIPPIRKKPEREGEL
jgi:hypothetical protein